MHCSRTLQLYILRETLKVFVLAVVAVNLVMNFAAIITCLHKFPLPLAPLIKIVLFRTPQLFPWTLPMALLLALTLTYGRLATDNEVMAMQASGIHMAWIILPGVVLGIILSMGLYVVNDHLLPWCKRKEYRVHRAEAANMLPHIFRSRNSFDLKTFQLIWEGVQGNTISKLKVTQRNDKGEIVMYCDADTAGYRLVETTDPQTGKTALRLELLGKNVSGMTYPDVRFTLKEKELTIPLRGLEPRDPGPKSRSIKQLLGDLAELRDTLPRENRRLAEELEQAKNETEVKLRHIRARMKEDNVEESRLHRLEKQADKTRKRLTRKTKEIARLTHANNSRLKRRTNDILIRMHLRTSLAASALALALVGIPLGILSGGGQMLKAFVLACLPVLLFYYPLFLLGRNLAETHTLSEAVAIWSPTVLQAFVGMGLIVYLFRR